MTTFKKLLATLFHRLAQGLATLGNKLDAPEFNPFELTESFSTFEEGMACRNYSTRHDAAAKLVGWYLYQGGHPLVEELIRAAEIMLEDTTATAADVSFLVGAWKDQASATTDEDRQAAEERENAIYERVAIKVQQ